MALEPGTWTQVEVLPCTSWVVLPQSLSSSGPQFLVFEMVTIPASPVFLLSEASCDLI